MKLYNIIYYLQVMGMHKEFHKIDTFALNNYPSNIGQLCQSSLFTALFLAENITGECREHTESLTGLQQFHSSTKCCIMCLSVVRNSSSVVFWIFPCKSNWHMVHIIFLNGMLTKGRGVCVSTGAEFCVVDVDYNYYGNRFLKITE